MLLGPTTAPSAHETPTTDNNFRKVPIHGHFEDGTRFRGTMNVRRFSERGGELLARVIIDGVRKDENGNVVERVDGVRRALAVGTLQGSTCRILHLELGPLDLNLLGLRVQLNRVILDITAERGPGNLLGNLLCAIAGLLDPPGTNVDVLARILSAIVQALRL
jgi:hypothetical protein